MGLNQIELMNFQTDYVKKYKNTTFQTGLKYAHSVNKGNIQFYSKPSNIDNYQLINQYTNSNKYTEQVPSAYVLINTKYKKWDLNTGIRSEMTIAKGISSKLNTKLIDTTYVNLFPGLKIKNRLNDNWNAVFNYNRKINRPIYQDLDPFLWYLDSLTSIQGNTRLQPEFSHQSEVRLIRKQLILRYSFILTSNSMAQILKKGISGVNSVIFTKDNIQKKYTHTLAVEFPFEKELYSSYTTLAVNKYQFFDNRAEYAALNSRPQLYIYSYHSFKIKNWFVLELTAEYFGSSFDGFTHKKPYYYFTGSISKNFLKNENLSCSIIYNDFARTAAWAGKFSVNTFSNEYNQRFTTNYLRLNLSYTIPTLTSFNYQNKSINDTEFNRIKK